MRWLAEGSAFIPTLQLREVCFTITHVSLSYDPHMLLLTPAIISHHSSSGGCNPPLSCPIRQSRQSQSSVTLNRRHAAPNLEITYMQREHGLGSHSSVTNAFDFEKALGKCPVCDGGCGDGEASKSEKVIGGS